MNPFLKMLHFGETKAYSGHLSRYLVANSWTWHYTAEQGIWTVEIPSLVNFDEVQKSI